MLRELIVGVVGMAVLSAIFVLLVRHPDPQPGACSGCALAGACERQRGADSAQPGAADREACYVGAPAEDDAGPTA